MGTGGRQGALGEELSSGPTTMLRAVATPRQSLSTGASSFLLAILLLPLHHGAPPRRSTAPQRRAILCYCLSFSKLRPEQFVDSSLFLNSFPFTFAYPP